MLWKAWTSTIKSTLLMSARMGRRWCEKSTICHGHWDSTKQFWRSTASSAVQRPVEYYPSLLTPTTTVKPVAENLFHPVTQSVSLSDVENTLTIHWQGKETVEVPLLWLRDSCTCSKCFNQGAYQRNSCTINVTAKLQEAEITEGMLCAKWTDGHETKHSLADICAEFLELDSEKTRKYFWKQWTWNGLPLPVIPHDEVFTDAGLKELLANVQKFGFSLVKDCHSTEEATERLVRRVGPPMPTTFSQGMWTFTSDMARGDTAYSNCYLAPHTDTTYFGDPCRIQVFHCLDREGCIGGETILVDGFDCAETIRQKNPTVFNSLTTIPQECIYQEPGICYKWTDTIIKKDLEDPTLIKRIRFNIYDRSPKPPKCSIKEMNTFYKSLKDFADLTQNPRQQLLMRLTPGTVLFIDNWRVLHGRTDFSGRRVLTGCYMSNDEFDHSARKSQVIA